MRTSARLSFLAGSPGADKLGGAKLGYVDTGVLLKIIDSTGDLYQVKLSNSHQAFVNKSDVEKDSTTKPSAVYLTTTFSVKGDAAYDYVNMKVGEKLPYTSRMEVKPSKIVVNLYGAQSNTTWISLLKSAKEIESVDIAQIEDDVVRITIDLNHRQHWGYSIYYRNHTFTIRVRRQPEKLSLKKMLIAVDAGHGGANNGAEGVVNKGLEKNYTLRFSNELEQYLTNRGVQVYMTRSSDTNITTTDRAVMLQSAMPVAAISIHFNSSANAHVQGVSIYYKHIGFKSLSDALLNRMLELNLAEFGNIGNFNFTLNALTDFPTALIEVAFLSNADDERKINDPRFQKLVAKKIYKALKDWRRNAKRNEG